MRNYIPYHEGSRQVQKTRISAPRIAQKLNAFKADALRRMRRSCHNDQIFDGLMQLLAALRLIAPRWRGNRTWASTSALAVSSVGAPQRQFLFRLGMFRLGSRNNCEQRPGCLPLMRHLTRGNTARLPPTTGLSLVHDIQRWTTPGGDGLGPLVHVQSGANAVAGAVAVVEAHGPQGRARQRVQGQPRRPRGEYCSVQSDVALPGRERGRVRHWIRSGNDSCNL